MIVNMIEADEVYAGQMEEKVFYTQRVAKDVGYNGLEKSRCEERKSTLYLYCQVFGLLAVI
jgi:hypothetical protein